jgi:G:T-mismatch repair DNA endonuclease (very short patch repair protein)
LPDTNYEFWNDKIKNNVNRDTLNYQRLEDMDWKYLVIWQCEIKNDKLENIKSKIIHFLNE